MNLFTLKGVLLGAAAFLAIALLTPPNVDREEVAWRGIAALGTGFLVALAASL